ncbi:MAG TPA: hypothetical protein PKD53_18600 [Chloroflexaceae bacterium]|nr:hypothetical protein [Chloroflexaceae bacterium]
MSTIADLLFVIIGTASITAFVVAAFVSRLAPRREPQVVYVSVPQEPAASGTGCLPLLILIGAVLGVLWLGL